MFISQSVKLISDNIWIGLVLWHRLDVYNQKLSIHYKCRLGRHTSMIMKSTQWKRFIYWIICQKLILVVRLKRSYENTGSVVCLTTKGRQLEWNFEELKPASHVPILGTILNIFDVFVAAFFSLLNSFFYTLLNHKNTVYCK
jgi:hypothetical protein